MNLFFFAGQAAVIVVVSLVNRRVREKHHIRPALTFKALVLTWPDSHSLPEPL